MEVGLLSTLRLRGCGMADTISRAFVFFFLLDYTLMFGVLVHWMVRTWLPKPSEASDPQRIGKPH